TADGGASARRRRDALGPDAQSYQAGREALQDRERAEQPQCPRRSDRRRAVENRSQDTFLRQHLEPLGDTRRPLATPLDRGEILGGGVPRGEGRREEICRSDRVLNRQVDAAPADG